MQIDSVLWKHREVGHETAEHTFTVTTPTILDFILETLMHSKQARLHLPSQLPTFKPNQHQSTISWCKTSKRGQPLCNTEVHWWRWQNHWGIMTLLALVHLSFKDHFHCSKSLQYPSVKHHVGVFISAARGISYRMDFHAMATWETPYQES